MTTGRPHRLGRSLMRGFAVIRRASRTGARAATDSAGAFPGEMPDRVSQWGLAVGDATAITNSLGFDLWVVPGSTGTCFVYTMRSEPQVVGAGNCAPNAMVLTGGLVSGLYSPDGSEETLIGLVPDGNSSVMVTRTDGSTESVPVSQNVYIVQGASGLASVTFRDASGRQTTVPTP